MHWRPLILLTVVTPAWTLPRWRQVQQVQQALLGGAEGSVGPSGYGPEDVLDKLLSASIIPDVTDPFDPRLSLIALWDNATTDLGNVVHEPSRLTPKPLLSLYAFKEPPSPVSQSVIVLTDPDAKSHDDPKWAEFAHWIAYWPSATHRPPLRSDQGHERPSKGKAIEVLPYKRPSPPPKTGKHRYVFLALQPLNGTEERLHLTVPSARKRWGHETPRKGVRLWAHENGLGIVGANFLYAENEEQ